MTFRAGDAITVYGDVDEDGFFVGELNGRRGLVPSNFLATDLPSADAQAQFTLVWIFTKLDQNYVIFDNFQGSSIDAPSEGMPSAAAMARSRKDAGVSFDERQMMNMDGNIPVDRQSRQPSSAMKPSTGPVPSAQKQPSLAGVGGGVGSKVLPPGAKIPGQLKKTDSTVGNKTPPKKASVAQGSSAPASRKTSVAAKPASVGK